MALAHRLDPPVQVAAAQTFGKLVAQGILTVEDVVPQLVDAAIRAGYRGHRHGLRARMHWTVAETAEHWRRERDGKWGVRAAIRQEVEPLAEDWLPAMDLHVAARDINRRRGEPLLRHEVWRLVDEIIAERLARHRKVPERRRRHVR